MNHKSTSKLHHTISQLIRWIAAIFLATIMVILVFVLIREYQSLKRSAHAWHVLFLERVNELEKSMDAGTTPPPIPIVHEFTIRPDGTIKSSPTGLLQGVQLNPNFFFGQIYEMQSGERKVVLFQDLVDGKQRVHFVKRYADEFVVWSFEIDAFIPFEMASAPDLAVVDHGVIWFSNDASRIGNLYRHSHFRLDAGQFLLSFADQVPNFAGAEIIITQDINAELGMLLLIVGLLFGVFVILSHHTSKIQLDLSILQHEHAGYLELIKSLLANLTQADGNMTTTLEQVYVAISHTLEVARQTPLQFEEHQLEQQLTHELANHIVRMMDGLKKERQKLLVSEDKFRSIFEKSPIGIALFDAEDQLLDGNPAFFDIFNGSTAEELHELVLSPVRNLPVDEKTTLNQGLPIRYESVFDQDLNGRKNIADTNNHDQMDLDWLITPLINQNGPPEGYLVHVSDISERKRAKDNLQKSEKLLRGILDNLQDAFFRADTSGQFTYVNPAAPSIYGYGSEEQMIGLTAQDLYADVEQREALLNELRRKGSVTDWVAEGRRADGSTFWASMNARFLRDEGGHIVGTEGVVRDITQRKQAEDEICALTEQYHEAQKMGRNGHWSFDPESLIFLGSDQTCLMYGYPPGTVMTYEDIYALLSKDEVERVTASLFQLIEEGTRFEEVFKVTPRGSDETIIIKSIAERIFDDHGKPLARGILQDITERNLAEQELQAREHEARHMAQQLRAVNEISLKIAAGLDFDLLMRTLYELCQLIGETDTFYIALHDADTGIFTFPISYKDGERRNYPSRSLKEQPGLTGHIIEHGETLYIPELTNKPPGLNDIPQPGQPSLSYLGVPLLLNNEILGVLSMQSHTPHAYSEGQISTLEMLATQMSIAIQNSRLYAQMQNERDLANALIDYMPGAFFLVDSDRRLVHWNKLATKILGYSQEEIAGLHVEELIITEEPSQAINLVSNIMESEVFEGEVSVLTKPGTTIPLFLNTVKIKVGGEECILGIGVDITERKQAALAIEESRQRLEVLAQKVITAQEEERQRISRELHDDSGQLLTTLMIQLSLIANELSNENETVHTYLEDASELVSTTLDRLRTLAHNLRPPVLETVGLSISLEDLCRDFASRMRVRVKYKTDPIPELPEIVQITLYRFTQEALTNMAKHAQAQEIQIQITYKNDNVSLTIQDDGIGFEQPVSGQTGMGLKSMAERTELVGGTLEIQSKPGKGTCLKVCIPVGVKKRNR
jgi:PAS domain S-box-containing protein